MSCMSGLRVRVLVCCVSGFMSQSFSMSYVSGLQVSVSVWVVSQSFSVSCESEFQCDLSGFRVKVSVWVVCQVCESEFQRELRFRCPSDRELLGDSRFDGGRKSVSSWHQHRQHQVWSVCQLRWHRKSTSTSGADQWHRTVNNHWARTSLCSVVLCKVHFYPSRHPLVCWYAGRVFS